MHRNSLGMNGLEYFQVIKILPAAPFAIMVAAAEPQDGSCFVTKKDQQF